MTFFMFLLLMRCLLIPSNSRTRTAYFFNDDGSVEEFEYDIECNTSSPTKSERTNYPSMRPSEGPTHSPSSPQTIHTNNTMDATRERIFHQNKTKRKRRSNQTTLNKQLSPNNIIKTKESKKQIPIDRPNEPPPKRNSLRSKSETSDPRILAAIKKRKAESQNTNGAQCNNSKITVYWNNPNEPKHEITKIIARHPNDLIISQYIIPDDAVRVSRDAIIEQTLSKRNTLFFVIYDFLRMQLEPKIRGNSIECRLWMEAVVIRMRDLNDSAFIHHVLSTFEAKERGRARAPSLSQKELIKYLRMRCLPRSKNSKIKTRFDFRNYGIGDKLFFGSLVRFFESASRAIIGWIRSEDLKCMVNRIVSRSESMNINISSLSEVMAAGHQWDDLYVSAFGPKVDNDGDFDEDELHELVQQIVSGDTDWDIVGKVARNLLVMHGEIIRFETNLRAIDIILKWKLNPLFRGRNVILIRLCADWGELMEELMKSILRATNTSIEYKQSQQSMMHNIQRMPFRSAMWLCVCVLWFSYLLNAWEFKM